MIDSNQLEIAIRIMVSMAPSVAARIIGDPEKFTEQRRDDIIERLKDRRPLFESVIAWRLAGDLFALAVLEDAKEEAPR